ncbi:MAG: GntR family transcriptional regulator [Spongiibacteraceae bacterium]
MNKQKGLLSEGAELEIGSAVETTARLLREEFLQRAEPGVFLGSEDELMQRFGVSRATFRQAMKLLEHEELVTIRRGVGGGFFTRRPSANGVAHMAAVYLIFQRTPIEDVLHTAMALRVEAVRQISASRDKKIRTAPREYLERHRDLLVGADRREATRAVNGYHLLLAELSNNKVLELVMNVVRMFGNRSDALVFTPERLCEHAEATAAEAAAMERGDAVAAEAAARLQNEISLRWLKRQRK